MRQLFPPIARVEQRYSVPSDRLLSKVARADPTASNDLRKHVQEFSDQLEVISGALEDYEKPPTSLLPESATFDTSDHLKELIRRRVAVEQRRYSTKPAAGQILTIERVVGPSGALEIDLSCPLAVLIEEPIQLEGGPSPDIWYGWFVSPDADYASYWDVLIEEGDGPVDPIAAMIQVWNPVYIYIPSTQRVVGELPLARLRAVRAVADELLTAPEPVPVVSRPGAIGVRDTLDGLSVVTGTPLSGPNDPRWRYQEIYFDVAEAVRLPARLAQEAAERAHGWDTFLAQLLSPVKLLDVARTMPGTALAWLDKLKSEARSFGPAPELAHLGGEISTTERSYRLDDWVELQYLRGDDEVLVLRVVLLREPGIVVRMYDGAHLTGEYPLRVRSDEALLSLERARPITLLITDQNGQTLYLPKGS